MKACPFCGEHQIQFVTDMTHYHVTCAICHCRGPSGGDEESAKYQWDQRPNLEESIFENIKHLKFKAKCLKCDQPTNAKRYSRLCPKCKEDTK